MGDAHLLLALSALVGAFVSLGISLASYFHIEQLRIRARQHADEQRIRDSVHRFGDVLICSQSTTKDGEH